jgi:ABC-2 type transport system permease protein
LIAATLVVVAAAGVLAARRDLGGGLVAPRSGRANASNGLGHPIGLAVRLQRGALLGWSFGIVVTGIAYGWIGPTVDAFIGHNKALAELLAGPGGANLTDSYFAASFRLIALLGTGFAIQSCLRLRSEETSMHAESLLATPVSRWRWAASHLAVAIAGTVILLGIAGLATGLTYGAAGGDLKRVPGLFGAALVYAPPMWLMSALAIALVGLAPRWAGASWAMLAAFVVVGFLGAVLHIPGWLQNLSPFERVPQVPAASLSLLPLVVISGIAAALAAAGLIGLRQRDIGVI